VHDGCCQGEQRVEVHQLLKQPEAKRNRAHVLAAAAAAGAVV
jgi:hypothetical protein